VCGVVDELDLRCQFGLALVVSELVTNAVRYGNAPIELAIHAQADRVRVEVTDASPVPPALRIAPPGAISGRGLALVDSIASSWGMAAVPGHGKVVWAEVNPDELASLG